MIADCFNLATLFESLASVIPESTALVCGSRRLTYRELDARATRLASAWRALGVGRGSHIGLYLYNNTEFVEAMIAAFKLRAVPININYRYVAGELTYLLDNADIELLVYQRELGTRVSVARSGAPGLKHLVHVEDQSGVEAGGWEFEALLAAGDPDATFGLRSGDDRYILYTGGTTGMPRGVEWRHEDVFYAALQGGAPGGDPYDRPEQVAENVFPDGGMNMHPAPPLIHGASQFAAWIAFFTGGKVALVPGKSFDPMASARLIQEESITVLQLVGDAMARPLAEAMDLVRPDVSSMMCLTSAGAILSREVRLHLERLLPDAMVMNNFGASETGHQGSALYEAPDAKPRWMLDATTAVLDDNGAPVLPGSGVTGRLARSGRIPQGYYKDPEKTARTFLTIAGVRWVVPGDLATVDAEGGIVILGRGAVCINSGGEKVFPEEVEEALKGHPSVYDAVVVGVPDARWGERVEALVQIRAGHDAPDDVLDAWARTRVAAYKAPRRYHRLVQIERHPSGKPDYRWALEHARAADS